MRIGELAHATGESVKTLRYWHDESLLEAVRSESGYRLFRPDMRERARFIRYAQGLGFTLADVRDILELRDEGVRPCDEVRERLASQLGEVRARLTSLRDLAAEIEARLAWAEAHPDPECDDGCVYLEAPLAREAGAHPTRTL